MGQDLQGLCKCLAPLGMWLPSLPYPSFPFFPPITPILQPNIPSYRQAQGPEDELKGSDINLKVQPPFQSNPTCHPAKNLNESIRAPCLVEQPL